MKTLIIGAGPLGSMYTYLFQQAGIDVTLLARGARYEYLERHGLTLVNEFTDQTVTTRVQLINHLHEEDEYDLAIVLVRKNKLKQLLPKLRKAKLVHHFLFMGNNTAGFSEYLEQLPEDKVLFGFPGGGGSVIDQVVHFVDSEKPGGSRLPITIGEIDGQMHDRTRAIQGLFQSAGVPTRVVDDIDSWLKYHVAFILPLAGALLKSGDNYALANDPSTIRRYIQSVREGGRVLKALGYRKHYNPKFALFYWLPTGVLTRILSAFFSSKFSEVAMMMHVRAAKDEMSALVHEFRALMSQSHVPTPHLHRLFDVITPRRVEELEKFGASLEMPKEAVKVQETIMLRALRQRFGVWGMLSIFLDTFLTQRRLRRLHPEARARALSMGEVTEKELFAFSSLFLALAKRLGREQAYEFFRTEVLQDIARISMPSLYQVNDLIHCEGDVFENFKKMNLALFQRTTEDGTWLMEDFRDEPDKLTIKITTCTNVELFDELGVPELGKFGCDHDLAGYPVIQEKVHCDFRRLCTIAKGSDHCLFEFYRKGTAPHNEHLNV